MQMEPLILSSSQEFRGIYKTFYNCLMIDLQIYKFQLAQEYVDSAIRGMCVCVRASGRGGGLCCLYQTKQVAKSFEAPGLRKQLPQSLRVLDFFVDWHKANY